MRAKVLGMLIFTLIFHLNGEILIPNKETIYGPCDNLGS